MNIYEQLKETNKKSMIYGITFLGMGATALAYSFPSSNLFLGVSGAVAFGLSIPQLIAESITRYKINKKKDDPLKSTFTPTIYQYSFTDWFDGYIHQSNNAQEKRLKIIFTSYVLRELGIQPKELFFDPYSKSYELSNQYTITNHNGKTQELFSPNVYHIEYNKILQEDLLDKDNLLLARTIFRDFESAGILGKYVAKCFGINDALEFASLMQDDILNSYDILEIQKATLKIKETKHEERRMNMPARGKEEDFIFRIIDKNPDYLKELTDFHIHMHCHNGNCSYPKLIEHLNHLNQIYDMNAKLENSLAHKKNYIKKRKI